MRISIIILASLVLAACQDQTPAWDPPQGQLPQGVSPLAYRLDLQTDPEDSHFSGSVQIDIRLDAPHSRIWLHARNMESVAVRARVQGDWIDGTFNPADEALEGVAALDFAERLPAGEATLQLDYRTAYSRNLDGLYQASQGGAAYLATQMEPISARLMVPSFDEPRFKTPWTLSVVAPSETRVIANGARLRTEDLGGGNSKHYFATTQPIPSYLLALAVGPYEHLDSRPLATSRVRGEQVPLRGFAPAGKAGQLADALDSTHGMVAYQEDYFGQPYAYGKLDLIAVPDFAFGAMENVGAIIYRESLLLINQRTSLARRRQVFTVHAHELAHQWFGNLVTPKWWDDIWLNEAFATWFSYKTMHDMDPQGGFDRSAIRAGLGAMGQDSLMSTRQIRNPITNNADILDAFDAITYSKGGHVLAMFESYVGADKFRDGIRQHMERYAHSIADVDDFMRSLARGSGQPDIVPAFRSFISQPGIPLIDVQLDCRAGAARLRLGQGRYAPLGSRIDGAAQSWKVPFAARTPDADVQMIMEGKTTELGLDSCPEWVMPNAGGAGYWRFTTSDANWRALIDNFAELSAGEQLVLGDSAAAAFRTGRLSAGNFLGLLAASADGTWDVAQRPMGSAAALIPLLSDASAGQLRQRMSAIYRPLWQRLQGRDDLPEGDVLLRQSLQRLLVGALRDERERTRMKERAHRFVGLDGAPQADALQSAFVGSAMAAAAEDGDARFFDAALAHASRVGSQFERRIIMNALAGNGPTDSVMGLLERALEDEQFSSSEVYGLVLSAMGHRRDSTQDAVWQYLQDNFARMAGRVPSIRRSQLGGLAGAFCDAGRADEIAAFLRANEQHIQGYQRSLAQGMERAQLCAALKEHLAGVSFDG